MASRQYRDLLWCINSPGIVCATDIYPDDAWFEQLGVSADVDDTFPVPHHPQRFRLGVLFEHVWQYWFNHNQTTALLSANLQVREPNHTVGEFDFIVDHKGQIEHWEVAVKFYLGCHDTSDIEHWYGPNTSDRLALKLARLHDHQLQLRHFDAAISLLAEHNLDIQRVRGMVKGRLFYPYEQFDSGEFKTPQELNANHQKGWWMEMEVFRTKDWTNTQFAVLEKQWWLAEIGATDAIETLEIGALMTFLSRPEAERATHIVLLDTAGVELSRGFVVNQDWVESVSGFPSSSSVTS